MKERSGHCDKPRLCFVAHFAYGAVTGGNSGHIGGVERQTSLMAKWFAARGYPVSMITWDEGQEDGKVIDGVQVFKVCRQHAGLPGLRFFWPRWTGLNSAMKRADADIYYQNNAECVTGQVALWCRRHGRKFVYSVASNTECQPTLSRMKSQRDRMLYRYGLMHSDRVIVQTREQQRLLESGFGIGSVVLPMPCPGPNGDYDALAKRRQPVAKSVLWIGRICQVKRPDRLLDLAQMCPDIQFHVVGPSDNTDYSRDVCSRASTIPNVRLHGPASRQEVASYYEKALLLCCTSNIEGFPNTFLEAWSYGLPVVTTFDPDALVRTKGLGRVGETAADLATGLRSLLESPGQWREASESAREYYACNHAVDPAIGSFEREFMRLCSSNSNG